MKKLIGYSFIILLLVTALTRCTQQEENVVVTVGDLPITDSEIRDVLKTKYPNQENFKDIELDKKIELLKPLIDKNLRISEAYNIGLDQDDKFLKTLEDRKMRMIGSKYYEYKIVNELLPESEIQKILDRQGVELKASHILIGFEGARSKSTRTKDEAQKLAEKIIKELKAGENFATSAQKYSDDPSAKKNNGDLGYFTWGRMVGPFQEAAWKLEIGEISEPVETMFGFHIIKLEDRREVPNYKPDRSQRNILRLKQTLMQSKGDSAQARWLRHYDSLKKKYNYVIYEDSIKYVSNMLREKLKVEQIIPGSFTTQQKEITLAEYDGVKITLNTLIEKFKDQLLSAFRKFQQENVLKSEIDRSSMNRLVMLDAEEMGIDTSPEIVEELKKFTDAQMNTMVEKEVLDRKINPTEEELKAYYELNTEKFKKDAEIEIWEIYLTDEKLSEKVAQKAMQGINFEQLVQQFSTDKALKKKGGYLGFKNIGGRGTVSREAHKLGPGGKIGGPVKYRRGWVVFKTGKENPETIMSYEEAKTRVKNFLVQEQRSQAKTEWQINLKDKYPVNIDEDKLKEI